MGDCLVLNSDGRPLTYYPLSTVTWQMAMCSWFKDKTYVLNNHENWVVRTVNETFPVPSVQMMRKYQKPPQHVKFTRKNVYIRDKFQCQYCHEHFVNDTDNLTLDHVIPKSKGGEKDWGNIVTSCKDCNTKKGSREGWAPLNDPVEPDFHSLASGFKLYAKIQIRDWAWLDYLEWPKELVIFNPPPNNK